MLNKLENDLLMQIYKFLEIKDIIFISRIGNYLNNLVRKNYITIIKYIIPNYKINLNNGDCYITFKKKNYVLTISNKHLILKLSCYFEKLIKSD